MRNRAIVAGIALAAALSVSVVSGFSRTSEQQAGPSTAGMVIKSKAPVSNDVLVPSGSVMSSTKTPMPCTAQSLACPCASVVRTVHQ